MRRFPLNSTNRCCSTCQFYSLERFVDPCAYCVRHTFHGEYPKWKLRRIDNPYFMRIDRIFDPPRVIPWKVKYPTVPLEELDLLKEFVSQKAQERLCEECEFDIDGECFHIHICDETHNLWELKERIYNRARLKEQERVRKILAEKARIKKKEFKEAEQKRIEENQKRHEQEKQEYYRRIEEWKKRGKI